MDFHALSGMRDYIGAPSEDLRTVINIASDLFQSAGFREIETPIMEDARLFDRSLGSASDIVSKEMYTVEQSGDRIIALRPENTAGVVRAVNQHSLMANRNQLKLFYAGSMFRHERPQSGRYRQFHQVGVEVFGRSDPVIDAEIVHLGAEFLERCGLNDVVCLVNSIGNLEEREQYKKELVGALDPYREELSDDDRRRLEENPLRVLDSKDETCQQICEDHAPSIRDYLGNETRQHFESVLEYLDDLGVTYELDDTLVRGLDYYSRTTFELVSEDLGAQDALCGGGRYDGLSEVLGGDPCPAIGFAAGLERIMMLRDRFESEDLDTSVDCYLVPFDEESHRELLSLLPELRTIQHPQQQRSVSVELGDPGDSLRSQLRRANRYRSAVTLLLGSDERENNEISLKRMDTGDQRTLDYPPAEKLFDQIKGTLLDVDPEEIASAN
ncbi:MAG: histidine--tRNA ligase [bacterium]